MKLTINNIQQNDYGTYKCVAKNPRGETDGTIRLYSEYLLFFVGGLTSRLRRNQNYTICICARPKFYIQPPVIITVQKRTENNLMNLNNSSSFNPIDISFHLILLVV
ncbi:I-set and/or V-set domain containing protein [Asbolus verrucosus]|uniref:I-set and/or V-set domain containing protein n=1 Tax=Asbolus verrucosus TaxID=1661398 RepID=A0A482WCZ2_ASBVE|nr:I-set and/or V-set domain containing protein [Asbolus verrucosus]